MLLHKKQNKDSAPKKSKRNTLRLRQSELIPSLTSEASAKLLAQYNSIEPELYIKNDVKRGLRNANGTGVVVGLTNIGEVCGYTIDNQGNKLPMDGKLYYRGYDIEDLVKNSFAENRFGFEEASYLLIMGELPSKTELENFNQILGAHRDLIAGLTSLCTKCLRRIDLKMVKWKSHFCH